MFYERPLYWTQSGQYISMERNLGRQIMLVLTRKIGEKVMIGDDVSVTILGLFGNHVRLGVDAPKSVEIHREEIYVKIQNEEDNESTAVAVGQ